jgi:hypothetical protein
MTVCTAVLRPTTTLCDNRLRNHEVDAEGASLVAPAAGHAIRDQQVFLPTDADADPHTHVRAHVRTYARTHALRQAFDLDSGVGLSFDEIETAQAFWYWFEEGFLPAFATGDAYVAVGVVGGCAGGPVVVLLLLLRLLLLLLCRWALLFGKISLAS